MTHKKRAKEYQQHLKDKCVINKDCLGQLDPDHFKTLGSGGSDCAKNILTLCRKHHVEKGQLGATTFAEKYVNVKIWLTENGWEFDEFRGKWINARSTHP